MSAQTITTAALELAAAGWPVFPCIPTGERAKAPLVEHGHLEGTTDSDQIRAWWRRWPNGLIGARVPDVFAVLDIDPRNGGSLNDLERLAGPLPATLTAWSGRDDGGRHLYYLRPAGELTSCRLPIGIDLKVGGRGYCIMPPSIHPATGLPYSWHESPTTPTAIPKPYPSAVSLSSGLRELLRPPPRVRPPRGEAVDPGGLIRTVAAAEIGNRNNALHWAACRAAESGTLDELEDELIATAVEAGEIESSARRTVHSARRTA
jgi:hypothetical protein